MTYDIQDPIIPLNRMDSFVDTSVASSEDWGNGYEVSSESSQDESCAKVRSEDEVILYGPPCQVDDSKAQYWNHERDMKLQDKVNKGFEQHFHKNSFLCHHELPWEEEVVQPPLYPCSRYSLNSSHSRDNIFTEGSQKDGNSVPK
jgi:hypothetical protein